MGKLFGTDGIRGIIDKGLDAKLAFRVGQAAALVLGGKKSGKTVFTIGKDTRISSDMLEEALAAGICSCGGDVLLLGVVPTPAVAYVTVHQNADAGIVISASHNPYQYNGIKIFNAEGFKLSDELELEIEKLVLSDEPMPVKSVKGQVLEGTDNGVSAYLDHLEQSAWGEIKGLRVALDCANGAASTTAARLFSRFPIDYTIISDSPNGTNINDSCGSTNPESLCETVVYGGYDIGIAFDGDADRCIVVDERGNVIDGDQIMGMCGVSMKKAGILKKDTIVATVMSNLGFHVFAKERGIALECTDVGDRNVLEKMLECGYNLGGEQSGHLIFLDDATTGDGQLAAVKLLSILSQSEKTVSELVEEIPQYPQVLLNVPVSPSLGIKEGIMADVGLKSAIRDRELEMAEKGRILVRPSGTEALIRVMVEAAEKENANRIAESIVSVIKAIGK